MPECWSSGTNGNTGPVKWKCKGGVGRDSRARRQDRRESSEMCQILQKGQVEIKWKRCHHVWYLKLLINVLFKQKMRGQDG